MIKDRYTGPSIGRGIFITKVKNILQLLAKRDTRTVAVVVVVVDDDDDDDAVVCDGASVSGRVTELLYELYTYNNILCLVMAEPLTSNVLCFCVCVYFSYSLYLQLSLNSVLFNR